MRVWAVLGMGLLACADSVSAPPDGPGRIDGGSGRDANVVPADAGRLPPPNVEAPTVVITTPTEGAVLDEPTLRIQGTADDDSGLASVFVAIGPNVRVAAASDDGFRTWSLEAPVPAGAFTIEAHAFDSDGRRSAPARVLVTRPTSGGGASPTVTITNPDDGSMPRATTVLVEGMASDDVAVVRMELERNGELLEDRAIETADFFASWARLVLLLPGEANRLVFRAYDELGNVGEASLTLFGQAEIDRAPPTLDVTSPSAGDALDAPNVVVTGSAMDRLGVREVKVRVGTELAGDLVYGDSVFATTTDGYATFEADVDIPVGAFVLEVKAIDVSGLSARVELDLENVFEPQWTEEERIPLFLREDAPVASVPLDLDRDGVNEVIRPSIQRDLQVLELDPGPLLRNALTQIKDSCGTDWRRDDPDPRHDCDLTALGRTYVGPDGTWETSAEYSLVRLLTMTPANVVVEGTSIEGIQGLADFLRLGGGFNEILAQTLGIARTDEIISTDNAADSLRVGLVATHPNTGPAGELPITLYDAMNDLAPLSETFGPVAGHPGVLDPSEPPFGAVFGPDFRMRVVAESNLRWLDGVDLSEGKEYISIVVDETGPTFDDVLEFDFTDPERFQIDGIPDDPTTDLRFRTTENDAFIPSCNGLSACQDNLPDSPLAGYVWETPGWEIEHVVTRGGLLQYSSRRVDYCPGPCFLARIEVGQGGNPAGWTEFGVFFDLGGPPEDQYLWSLISEVAQVALHRLPAGTLAEGEADVAFTLRDVGIGVTADEIRAAVRPEMQAQASELSARLLGDYSANNGRVDFFYRRGADGRPYVYFAAEEDPRPDDVYAYASPGFFEDEELTTKVSRTSISGSGDSTHEKLRLTGERTVYAEDEDGDLYRLRFVPNADDDDAVVWVSRRVR